MKKMCDKGFMLVETLVVTSFVAGVLIFLFIQFNNLSKNYTDAYDYNTVEGLYSLENVRIYLASDLSAFESIETAVANKGYIEITDCNIFTERNYCLKLFELENISKIFVTNNDFEKDIFFNYNDGFKKFISKVSGEGTQKYRFLVEFNDSTYATIRFGE